MTPSEFYAWFTGYGEHIAEAPTAEQWARIKRQVEVLACPGGLIGKSPYGLDAAKQLVRQAETKVSYQDVLSNAVSRGLGQ